MNTKTQAEGLRERLLAAVNSAIAMRMPLTADLLREAADALNPAIAPAGDAVTETWWREPPPGTRFLSDVEVRVDGINTLGWARELVPVPAALAAPQDGEAKRCPVPSCVTDEEIQDLFAGTNFGEGANHRKLMEQGVLKVWCGYHNGYTLTTILQQARLVSQKGNVTDRGRKFAFNAFYNQTHSG